MKFEDQLFSDLMAEHGSSLRDASQPAGARRGARRPVWLAGGAVGAAGAITAGVMALGGAPAYAAYTVTAGPGGAVSVSVRDAAGVSGANARLHAIHARVRVVPVRAGCVPMSSLPRPNPPVHLAIETAVGVGKDGHRSVTVRVGKPGIPQGDTFLLAFYGAPGPGHTGGGAGGLITGKAPACVSLPSAPPPGGGTGTSGPGQVTRG